MQPDLLIAIITGLGAMIGWGFSDFFAKKTIDKIGDYSTLFWAQLIGAIPLSLYLLLNQKLPVLVGLDPLYILGFGLLDAVSWIYLYKAFEKGEVSLLSPVFAAYAAIAVLISAFIFAEVIPSQRWLALGVVFIGIVLISINIQSFKGKLNIKEIKGFKEIILALAMYSVWIALWGHFINGKEWVFYLLSVRLIVAITVFIVTRAKKISLQIKDSGLWKYLILIGLFDVAAYSLVTYGFSSTNYISIVAMLSGAFSLPTIILAHIFLKEKATAVQTIGGIVVISGIILLSLFS